jgi:hypothetical protein
MDPPLHYSGLEALGALDVIVGATPVSLGGDSIVGSVEARSRPLDFATDASWRPSARVEAGYASGNNAQQFAVEAGAANDVLSLRYLGGYQDAGNYDSAEGEVATTGYTNRRNTLGAAYKHGSGVWELEAGTHRADDVGTPTLPMDMVRDDADRARLGFRGDTPLGALEAQVYRHEIDHLMDNYSLRPLMMGRPRMEAPSTSDDTGLTLALANPAGKGTVDTYYLTVMLDSGLLALPLFLLTFLIPAWLAFKYYRDAKTPEQQILAPLSIAIINFVIVKSVLTSEANIPLAFAYVGCIIGLVWQQHRLQPKRDEVSEAPQLASRQPSAAPPRRAGCPGSRA